MSLEPLRRPPEPRWGMPAVEFHRWTDPREMVATKPGTPGEWFPFAVELKQTCTPVGDCGLRTEADGRQAEIGFTFSHAYQGRALASVAIARLPDYAFGELDYIVSMRSPTRRTRPRWRYSSGLAYAERATS